MERSEYTQVGSWQRISSRIAYESPFMKIREDAVVRPDGENGLYSVVCKDPAVFIVPMGFDDRIYLIKQFRYPVEKESWELPSGGIENENPLDAAKRELQEETGLIACKYSKVGNFDAVSAYSDQLCTIFLAEGLIGTEYNKQLEEGITEVRNFTFPEIFKMIRLGRISHAHTIAALFQTQIFLQRRDAGRIRLIK